MTASHTTQHDAGKTQSGKRLSGVVVGTGMKDTASVLVTRRVKHPRYGKYIQRRKKYLAHDTGNTCSVGDQVVIQECRPISKRKNFKIISDTTVV
jgi:small subunit ribosomal protein S17